MFHVKQACQPCRAGARFAIDAACKLPKCCYMNTIAMIESKGLDSVVTSNHPILAREGMMAKSLRRLGRGLDSLVSDLNASPIEAPMATPPHAAATKEPAGIGAMLMKTSELRPNPFQPRSDSQESIADLARSIKQSGMLQPIAVRPTASGFQIIAGERRWWAAKSLDMTEVPVIVRDATDEQMIELALIENIQREDLNAIDRARAYERYCQEFKLKPDQVAERLGEDRTTVTNYLRILELDDRVQQLLIDGQISMGHARCLLSVGDVKRRFHLASEVAASGLSVRALEQIVRNVKRDSLPRADADSPAGRNRQLSPHITDIQRRFEDKLKTKVSIREGAKKGTGRITLHFYSLDDFERIAEAIGVHLD